MGQFKALSYKNWVLFKRGYIGSALEVLIPLIIIGMVILARRLLTVV